MVLNNPTLCKLTDTVFYCFVSNSIPAILTVQCWLYCPLLIYHSYFTVRRVLVGSTIILCSVGPTLLVGSTIIDKFRITDCLLLLPHLDIPLRTTMIIISAAIVVRGRFLEDIHLLICTCVIAMNCSIDC